MSKNLTLRKFTGKVLALAGFALAISSSFVAENKTTLSSNDIKKIQESLRDKGYYSAPVNGQLGPKTRAAIREYQKSENLQVNGQLDTETAGKLSVGPESAGGNFKEAGKEVKAGTLEAGHEMKQGKPVAAGKEMGKGVKKAVDPDSDRGDREKKEKESKKEQ